MKKFIKYVFPILLPLCIAGGLRGWVQSNKTDVPIQKIQNPFQQHYDVSKLQFLSDTLEEKRRMQELRDKGDIWREKTFPNLN